MVTNLTQYLDVQNNRRKNKIAVQDEKHQLTFGQLYSISTCIGSRINGDFPSLINKPIIVFMPKGILAYSELIGVLYSGNYYVPLDTKMPIARLKMIISLLESELALTSTELAEKLDEAEFKGKKIILDSIDDCNFSVNIPLKQNRVIDTDPAYVLFTSGSTGVPKGVVISHRAVIDYIEWQCGKLDFDETSVLGSQAPFYFDASMPDIFTPLTTGATLTIIPEHLFIFPPKLIEYLNQKNVNTLIWVPSALVVLSTRNYFSKALIEKLRLVMFCGEVMPVKHLNIWRRYYPNTTFINLYGPTEAAYACTYYVVRDKLGDDQTLPIGQACGNTAILLLDENGVLVTEGEGELCIRGSCLANGYFKNKEKTDEVFIPDPTNKYYSQTIYRSGDIVRYNSDGDLEYLGRKDFQIKHQGYRIELGEIEAAAYGIFQVKQCCAIYDEVSQHIILFYVSEPEISEKEIYLCLKERLPKYMLPSVIYRKNKLPLNANGKIDRLVLKKELCES